MWTKRLEKKGLKKSNNICVVKLETLYPNTCLNLIPVLHTYTTLKHF